MGVVSLGIVVVLGAVRMRPAVSPDAARELAQASAYFDSTVTVARVSRPQGPRGDELALALGYLERLRLGLGSPFRLVDDALNDPRLSDAMQSRVAWALLDRLRRGDAYVVDPLVLDGSGPWLPSGQGARGAQHVSLIANAITGASDPRAGELAVRLAYLIAAANGSIATSSVSTAAEVAAQLRDRALAEVDVRRLLADANASHVDVLMLLRERRAVRQFAVEQPPLAPLGARLQVEAMNAVPALVRALDTLAAVTNGPANEATTPAPAAAELPVLNAAFAARLAARGSDRPSLAQIVVPLRTHVHSSLHATNEETLTAASVLAAPESAADTVRRANALALLSSAVALRTLAQAAPWFPGDGGPDARLLVSEFGLRDVTFARAVPTAWRPFYLRQLGTALRDMRSVLPELSFQGLNVHFGAGALQDSALAMHDPRTRTLELSIASSAGTMAHELAHDLDWQEARRLYASEGGYSTDRAAHDDLGTLATSVRALAEARLLRPFAVAGSPPPVDRPAELFARGTDWFVATTLAARGRSDGFLTAVEDGFLSGYALGEPAAVGVSGAQALLAALGQMTSVPDSARRLFEAQWSDPLAVDPVLLVRRALETPLAWRSLSWRATGAPLDAVPAAVCFAGNSPEARARERLLMLAIDARAHGLALRRARGERARGVERVEPAWVGSLLGAPPWSAEPAAHTLAALRQSVAHDVLASLSAQGLVPAPPAIFRSSDATCSTSDR